jgi:hypothetical protein
MIMLFGLLDGADSGVNGAAVMDAPPAEPAGSPSEPVTPQEPPAPPAEPPPADPNDPMAALQAAMDAQLGKDEPVTPPATPEAAAQPQIPPEFAQALQISDFVKEPAHVEQAIRAADEVWKVASGQAPASSLLEGMRAANPEGFKAVIGDLIPYIEQITGRAFTNQPPSPPDPNRARLDAIEKRFADQETERRQSAYREQVQAANKIATDFIGNSIKGTFAEGQDARFYALLASKLDVSDEGMRQLLGGNIKPLEKAIREVKAEEVRAWKAYGENVKKQQHTLANAVPAVKGGNGARPPAPDSMKALPGETTSQAVTRLLQGRSGP